MEHRRLGRTDREVGVVGAGAWQLGGDWGDVPEEDALADLRVEVTVEVGTTVSQTRHARVVPVPL